MRRTQTLTSEPKNSESVKETTGRERPEGDLADPKGAEMPNTRGGGGEHTQIGLSPPRNISPIQTIAEYYETPYTPLLPKGNKKIQDKKPGTTDR